MFVGLVWGQGQECTIVNELAVGQSQLTERATVGKKSSDRVVLDKTALMKVDFEDVGAMLSKSKDSLISQLMTVVQF